MARLQRAEACGSEAARRPGPRRRTRRPGRRPRRDLHGRRTGRAGRPRSLAPRRRDVGLRVTPRRAVLLRSEPGAAARHQAGPAQLRRPRPAERPGLLVDRGSRRARPAPVAGPVRALVAAPGGPGGPAADGAGGAAVDHSGPARPARAHRGARPLPARGRGDVHRGGRGRSPAGRRGSRVPGAGRRAGAGGPGLRPVRGRRGGLQGRDRGAEPSGRADPGRLGAPGRAAATAWARWAPRP